MRIFELTNKECAEALTRLRLGRLACSRNEQPYIVPIYFAFHERQLYSFATHGQKIDWMRINPRVCIEADEIVNRDEWTSVIVHGRYEELPDTLEWKLERELTHDLLQQEAMWWEPACASNIHPGAADEFIPIYYCIHIDRMTGRRAMPDSIDAARLVSPQDVPERKSLLKRLLHR